MGEQITALGSAVTGSVATYWLARDGDVLSAGNWQRCWPPLQLNQLLRLCVRDVAVEADCHDPDVDGTTLLFSDARVNIWQSRRAVQSSHRHRLPCSFLNQPEYVPVEVGSVVPDPVDDLSATLVDEAVGLGEHGSLIEETCQFVVEFRPRQGDERSRL